MRLLLASCSGGLVGLRRLGENSRRLGNAGDDGDLVRGTDEGAGLVNGSERVAPHLEIEGEDERLTLNTQHSTRDRRRR
ncbi:hypothetical protein GBAR_LOCUS4138 [Geodia barretti]|uniref:Uncharacterized protein n=1 Tax=Geodia barretti TaxID=519541 RepID=A0AA35R5S6_GEOBA|nr:hypothetical protein GBAR_LOCUS4138 [Geodia barretti]